MIKHFIQSGEETQCLLSWERKSVCDWFSSNKLTNNPVKCEAMCFGRGKPEKIKIGSAELDHKTSSKYLGLHVDKKLSFHEHIHYGVKKLNRFCGLIYKSISHFYLQKCLLTFYKFFAKSIVCYGFLVYGSAAETKLQKIETIQRRLIRAMFSKTGSATLVDVLADHRFQLFLNFS